MSEPNVNVLKAPVRSRTNVRTLTSMAMLTALAYVVMLLSKMLPQVQHFLQMDLKDTIICIGGFLFGPLSAAVISIVVAVVEMFSVSDTGVEITNKLTEGDYAMDLNAFMPGKVTYMTRSDWNGTFPDKYEGLSATGRLATLLGNDFIDIPQNEDTDEYVWGDTTSKLTINDLKGAEFDDERW